MEKVLLLRATKMVKLTDSEIEKLKPYLLSGLPSYIEKMIKDILDDDKLTNFINETSKKLNKIVRKTNRAFCKSISSILFVCLRNLNYENLSIRNASFMLGNKVAKHFWNIYGLDGLISAVQNKYPNIYTLGAGFTKELNDFHTILMINDYILDATADQMNRPKQGIIMNNFILKLNKVRANPYVLIYDLSEPIKPDGIIFAHPKLKEILNEISTNIASILRIKPMLFNNIKTIRKNKFKFGTIID